MCREEKLKIKESGGERKVKLWQHLSHQGRRKLTALHFSLCREKNYEKAKRTVSAGLSSLTSVPSLFLSFSLSVCFFATGQDEICMSPRGAPAKHGKPNSDLQLLSPGRGSGQELEEHACGFWVRSPFNLSRASSGMIKRGRNTIMCSSFLTERSCRVPFLIKQHQRCSKRC